MRRAPAAWGKPGSSLVPPGVVASLRAEGAGLVGCQRRSTLLGSSAPQRPPARLLHALHGEPDRF